MSRRLLCAIFATLATMAQQFWPQPLLAAEPAGPLTVLVFHRPPYYELHDGKAAGGFLLQTALAAFDRATIPITVREMPPGRIVATVADGKSRVCAVGWIKTPEREVFARFSRPLYRNQPVAVAVGSSRDIAATPPPSLDALLGAGLIWGLREGFSYGKVFDEAFARVPSPIKRFSDTTHMATLLAQGRLDAMPIDPEELAWITGKHPDLKSRIRLIRLADAPPGDDRHIMCSTAVSPQDMARLDAAIGDFLATDQYHDLIELLAPR